MDDIAIDFMSPDADYYVETSCYRDEIRLVVRMKNGLSYLACLQTAIRARSDLALRQGLAVDELPLVCARGLIMVDALDPAMLLPVLSSATSTGYFSSQRPVEDLPLSFDGLKVYDKTTQSYYSDPLPATVQDEIRLYRDAPAPKVLQVLEVDRYLGLPFEQSSVQRP